MNDFIDGFFEFLIVEIESLLNFIVMLAGKFLEIVFNDIDGVLLCNAVDFFAL